MRSLPAIAVIALGSSLGCGDLPVAGSGATRAKAEDQAVEPGGYPLRLRVTLDLEPPAPDIGASAVHLTAIHNGTAIDLLLPWNEAKVANCIGPIDFCQRVLRDGLQEGEEETLYWIFDEIEVHEGDSLEFDGKIVTPDGQLPLRPGAYHRPFEFSQQTLADCGEVHDFNFYEHSGPASIGRVGVSIHCRCEPNRAGATAWAIDHYELDAWGIKLETDGDGWGAGRGEWRTCIADQTAAGKLEDKCFRPMDSDNVWYDEDTLEGSTVELKYFRTDDDKTFRVLFAAFEKDPLGYDIRAKSAPMVFNPATLATLAESSQQWPDFLQTDPRLEQDLTLQLMDEQSDELRATVTLRWTPDCRY